MCTNYLNKIMNKGENEIMKCKKCFTEIPEGATICPNCKAEQTATTYNEVENNYNQTSNPYQPMQSKPVSKTPYLIAAIISTICCCLPFSIVAIVYALKIDTAVAVGNMADAQRFAKISRNWIIASVAIGVIVLGGYIMLYATGNIADSYYMY